MTFRESLAAKTGRFGRSKRARSNAVQLENVKSLAGESHKLKAESERMTPNAKFMALVRFLIEPERLK
jgi:hypothetical protein